MDLRGLDSIDLNGILFSQFPDNVPLDECRDRLELLVYEVWEEDCAKLADDERPELCLSPYYIYRALGRKAVSEFRAMDKETRKKCLAWVWKDREERRKAFELKRKRQPDDARD